MTKDQILCKIIDYVEGNRVLLGLEKTFKPTNATILYGIDGVLDSLRLVHLIVAIENEMRENGYKSLTLSDAKAFSNKHSHFQTIETLSEYIYRLVSK